MFTSRIDYLENVIRSPLIRLLINLRELIVLSLFYLTFVTAPFGGPDLSVSYEVVRLFPPIKSSAAVPPANHDDKVPAIPKQLSSFVVSSNRLIWIHMKNNSNSSIGDLDLRVDGFRAVTDVAMDSDSARLMDNKDKISTYKLDKNRLVYFPAFHEIPPRAYVTFLLWGDYVHPLFGIAIHVESNAESTSIKYFEKTTGFGLFVANHLTMIFLILATYLLLLGLYRTEKSGRS